MGKLREMLLSRRRRRRSLAAAANDLRLLELNVKAFGYDLARRLAETLPVRTDTQASPVGLRSKASTQADIESDWIAHWSAELKVPVVYHRKIWEHGFILQALYEHGHLAAGARGLGFGCGREPIPSYLAGKGVRLTVTDLPQEDAVALGWASTNQHLASTDNVFHPHLVDRGTFDRLVEHQHVDMNHIPASLSGFDFCWSTCAMEHLGTIQQGLDFVENSLATIRPGGLSVHTMEFNIENDGNTLDEAPTVLFQRKHVQQLADRLRAGGHWVAELDFDYGSQPMDNFIDVPPGLTAHSPEAGRGLGQPYHLKVGLDGYIATCFGIVVKKAE
jgi:hypothetical protein